MVISLPGDVLFDSGKRDPEEGRQGHPPQGRRRHQGRPAAPVARLPGRRPHRQQAARARPLQGQLGPVADARARGARVPRRPATRAAAPRRALERRRLRRHRSRRRQRRPTTAGRRTAAASSSSCRASKRCSTSRRSRSDDGGPSEGPGGHDGGPSEGPPTPPGRGGGARSGWGGVGLNGPGAPGEARSAWARSCRGRAPWPCLSAFARRLSQRPRAHELAKSSIHHAPAASASMARALAWSTVRKSIADT